MMQSPTTILQDVHRSSSEPDHEQSLLSPSFSYLYNPHNTSVSENAPAQQPVQQPTPQSTYQQLPDFPPPVDANGNPKDDLPF